ncbi:MAG TPA: prepilin-type N-terminal cleavage/methylation domain-containing protein [Gemmatimonadaceae bacterium]|nr:prepilin-type N-terminal cleavage/methylation domain-containing protein [Gemmatimonadaceae bacterium]
MRALHHRRRTLRLGSTPRAAFTILELLVALVVTGLVLSVAYGGLHVASDAAVRMRRERASALAGPAARAALDGWLRAATLAGGDESFVGLHGGGGGGERKDELTFTVTDAGTLRPGPHRVRLWIAGDSTVGRGLLAELWPIHASVSVPAETLRVAPAATGLAIRYLVRTSNREWWTDTWQSDRQLPVAVELRVIGNAAATGDRGLPPILALPLRVPFGWVGR